MEPSRLSYIKSCKDTIFDEMVLQVAHQNGVPLMAAGWDSVLAEIELEVESLLMRPFGMSGKLSRRGGELPHCASRSVHTFKSIDAFSGTSRLCKMPYACRTGLRRSLNQRAKWGTEGGSVVFGECE